LRLLVILFKEPGKIYGNYIVVKIKEGFSVITELPGA